MQYVRFFCLASLLLTVSLQSVICAEENERIVVPQAELGKFACGPCAVLNALLNGKPQWKALAAELPGGTHDNKVRKLISRYGSRPSEAYGQDRQRYVSETGMTWVDSLHFFNDLLADHQLTELSGDYLDRREKESFEAHLRRIHQEFLNSVKQGAPPVVALRSFAPTHREEQDKYVWKGLSGHYVVIVDVQETIAANEKGFRFEYLDSFTGKSEFGYAYIDEARNFTAAKGDAENWKWVKNRPFLAVAAPSLRLQTQEQSWYLRTVIVLNYAIYQSDHNGS